MDKIVSLFEGMDTLSLIVVIAGILVAMQILPNAIKKMGIVKLGPLEMEHKQQTLNYEVNRKIDNIDISNRENLWDMTESVFFDVAEGSLIKCEAAVGYILSGVSSPIRSMVLLNHIAPKLIESEKDFLVSKINRGISRAIRDAKHIVCYGDCPIADDVSKLDIDKYNVVIEDWIARARSITSKACKDKIKVYEMALENTKDKHWVSVYKDCIDKNKSYINGMGYKI